MTTDPVETTAGAVRQPSARFKSFRALRYRDFRLLWMGLVVSATGTWMQIVAQSLLVLKITHGSALALGAVSLAQSLSFFLFALIGGTLADRFDKRRLLLFTQVIFIALAVLLGTLTLTGIIRFWMILVLAFLNGSVLSIDQPTRGALIPTLVPREELMNAVSLQAMVFNGASVLGPALAGVAVGTIGYAGNFFLNAVSFVGVLVALYLMRPPPRISHRQPMVEAIRDALGTVRRDAVLPWVLSAYGALLFCGPSAALILPFYAVNVLHVGPERLGLLFSAAGLGTILGALILASLGHNVQKGWLFFGGIFAWAIAFAVFAVSGWLWLSMAALIVFGAGQIFAGTVNTTLLQTRVPEHMRGRVMSLNTLLIMGVRPLGDFPAGALIAAIGAPETVLLSAAVVGGYGLLTLLTRPAVRSA